MSDATIWTYKDTRAKLIVATASGSIGKCLVAVHGIDGDQTPAGKSKYKGKDRIPKGGWTR